MTDARFIGELDLRVSSPGAGPVSWAEVESTLNTSEVLWFIPVRSGGQPHSVPWMAIWIEGAMYITTGPDEQKARNLATNPACSLTTGCNMIGTGFDVTVDGTARAEADHEMLTMLAARYEEKYGWRFAVRDRKLVGEHHNIANVYRIDVGTAYGFGKGESYTQTRWRFDQSPDYLRPLTSFALK